MQKILALLLFFGSNTSFAEIPDWIRADFRIKNVCRSHLSFSGRASRKRFSISHDKVADQIKTLATFLPRYSSVIDSLNWTHRKSFDADTWTGRIQSKDPQFPTRLSINIQPERDRTVVKIAISIKRPAAIVGDFSKEDFLSAVTEKLAVEPNTRTIRVSTDSPKDNRVFSVEMDFLPFDEVTFLNLQTLLKRFGFIED